MNIANLDIDIILHVFVCSIVYCTLNTCSFYLYQYSWDDLWDDESEVIGDFNS